MKRSILRVSTERWQLAQQWEGEIWRRQNSWRVRTGKKLLRRLGLRDAPIGDDWNHWWKEKLDGYRFIPGELDSAVKLGSGPHTNMRLILPGRTIRHVICADPLVQQYIKFRDCWLSQQAARQRIDVVASMAEASPFASRKFDLVILINVLDHVQDALASLRSAMRVAKMGGYFVLGQDLTNEEDMRVLAERYGDDIGHPIRLHEQDLDALLLGEFDPLIRETLPRESGRNPTVHYGTYLFAGRKL